MGMKDRLRRIEERQLDSPDWPKCPICGGYCDLKLRTFAGGVEDVTSVCPNRDHRLSRFADQRRQLTLRTEWIASITIPPSASTGTCGADPDRAHQIR